MCARRCSRSEASCREPPALMRPLLLDGPTGTELFVRGVPTPLPGWSAHALDDAPDALRAIHEDYVKAGARIHTTNTFRTRPAVFGERWEELARKAVRLVRAAIPAGHRVAGSIAPLEDCYRPDLSPADTDPDGTRAQHRALARILAEEGCDVLLCETFPHLGEAEIAMEEALATGVETWVSWTAGPAGDLLTPEALAPHAEHAVRAGAAAVLVNCVPASLTLPFVEALAAAAHDRARVGAYANAGCSNDTSGFDIESIDPERYADLATIWHAAGASILAGCCGTGPAHVAALARRFA